MSQDHHCRHESKCHQGPGTSSAAPVSRVFSFKGDLAKIHDCNTSKALKVKRRKTKKERNNAKFKSHAEIFKKKTLPRGVLESNDMIRKIVSQSGMKDNSRQVFITENRLTHHQGIFNREIKSIDIGRLVSQATEVGPPKTGTAHCTAESIGKTPQSQGTLSLSLIPTPEPKNQEEHSLQKEHSPEIPTHIAEPAACNQQDKEIEKCQSCPQSDDHANQGSETTMSPCRNQPTPVLETAESIVHMLNSHSLFPGRNLMSETQQAILEKVKHLRDSRPAPSTVPVQRKPEYSQMGSVHKYKDEGWESVGKGRTDTRKTVPGTQGARHPIQTPPIRFLPFPRDSPAHTLIKMTSSEDHLKLKDILHQPIYYGSDCNPSHKYQQISQSPYNILNINSSSHDLELRRQDRKASSFCRVRKAGKMTSSLLNAYSPQVRWRLANDLPTDLTYTHNVPAHNIRHILNPRVTNLKCVSKTPLEDISSEVLNPSRVRMKQRFSDGTKTSSDVFWDSRDQRSSTSKILDISPAAIRLSYREQSPHRMYSARNFKNHHSVFLPTLVTGTQGSLGVFPLDSFGELGSETRRRTSSWQEADIAQHRGRFATNIMPKHLHESRCHDLRDLSSLLQEEPKHRGQLESDGGIEWIQSKDWPYVRSHGDHYSQQRNMSVALSQKSVQQEPSFVPFPHEKSSRKVLMSRSSPDTWVYPRMKLY